MSRTDRQRLAGWLWLLAGLCYLIAEGAAAAAFPGYSYARNYVSDLGVPYADLVDGRTLRSGRAWVMNAGLTLDGVLFGAASLIAGRRSKAFLILALAHSLGTIMVAMVHSGSRELADGTHALHVAGAALAIIGGNAALLAAARPSPGWGLPSTHAAFCRALGIAGLIALALLEIQAVTGQTWLGTGTAERLSIYPITLWEIGTGLLLLRASGRR